MPAPDAVFDYVMGDVCTAIVVELVVTPPQVTTIAHHIRRCMHCLALTVETYTTFCFDEVLLGVSSLGPRATDCLTNFKQIVCACSVDAFQALPPGMVPTTHLVGWTAFTPFSYIADDGSQSEASSCPSQ